MRRQNTWAKRCGVGAAAVLLGLATGCARTREPIGFDVGSLVAASQTEEQVPALADVQRAPRVLVLPFADRAAPDRIGWLHNALDDLIRRDLLCLPHLSVFPADAAPVSVEAMTTPEYRTLANALQLGHRVGATHVLIGEVTRADQQVAIEADVISVTEGKLLHTVRLQEIERKLDKALVKWRSQVVAQFASDLTALPETVPGRTPPYKLLERCGFAQNRTALGAYSLAIVDYYAAAKEKDRYAGAYAGIAETQLHLGSSEIAERAFVTALTYDPDDVETYWRFALMRIRQPGGSRTEALALCQEAARRAPLFGPAHLTLGTLWFQEKAYEHADRHFRVAEALLPESVWPAYNHAHVLQAQGKLEAARAAFEAALARGPQHARVHVDLGLLERDLGDDASALEHFKAAAALEKQNSLYLYYVGSQFERLGQPDEAVAAYRAAAAYPFSHPWLHWKLGEAFLRANLLPDAEHILSVGYGDGARHPEHVLLYTRVLLNQGRSNPVRRVDYATRAQRILGNLLEHGTLTDEQRAAAEELARTAATMQQR